MPSESTHPVNAAFFGLAFIAELKLKLLGAEAIVACGRGDRIETYAGVRWCDCRAESGGIG